MEMVHIMTRHPETIGPDDTLAKAKEIMNVGGFRRLPVVKDGAIVGMLTERDLRQHWGYLESTKVDGAMASPVVAVTSHTTVQEAARLMIHRKIGGLPIVDAGKLIGIVTAIDMLKAFLEVVDNFERTHAQS